MMKNLIEKYQVLYQEKNYFKLSLYSAAIVFASLLVIATTYIIGMQVFVFLTERFEAVLIIVGAYILIYLWWKEKQKKQHQEIQNSLIQMTASQQSAEKALCESNYSTVRQCLFSTLSENADILNLVKPERLSELDSPSRTIFKGNVYMCQFVVVKKGDTNSEKIKEMLQIRIGQKLSAHEFAGITQTQYIYNGTAYPILCIDEVRDNGTFVQLDIAWASEHYCSLLNARAHTRMQYLQPQNINSRDSDF